MHLSLVYLVLFAVGAGAGLAVSFILSRGRGQRAEEAARRAVSEELVILREKEKRIPALEASLKASREEFDLLKVAQATAAEAVRRLDETNGELRQRLADETRKKEELQSSEAGLKGDILALKAFQEESKRGYEEKLALLMEARETLSTQFKNLASEILEEKSQKFTLQNQEALKGLLDPVKVKLGEFQAKVEEVYVKEGKDRSALHAQVTQLMELNRTLSDEAQNLTRALKGSGKTQGNWGELLLNNVLEGSGLRKGIDYETQESHTREDGSRAQPDVVIHLPEGRHLVIDSKVSLNAYVEYVEAPDDVGRQSALKKHVDSVRRHIGDLSSKKYQTLHNLNSIDFVLMFVPVEPAFMLAVTNDGGLFAEAWERNVLLVSPSTLLFVLRTVAHLWRQEDQKANAQEIARRGAEFYDRLSAFVEELQKVGQRIDQARDSYQEAWNKLCRNKGNVIRQAEMLKELGVSPTRSLPSSMATSEEGALPEGERGEDLLSTGTTRSGRRGRPRKAALSPADSAEENTLSSGESALPGEPPESV